MRKLPRYVVSMVVLMLTNFALVVVGGQPSYAATTGAPPESSTYTVYTATVTPDGGTPTTYTLGTSSTSSGMVSALASASCQGDCSGTLRVFWGNGCGSFQLSSSSRFYWAGVTSTIARFNTWQRYCALGNVVDFAGYVAAGSDSHRVWYDHLGAFYSQDGAPYFCCGYSYNYNGHGPLSGAREQAFGDFKWCASPIIFTVCVRYHDRIDTYLHYDGTVYYHLYPGRTV